MATIFVYLILFVFGALPCIFMAVGIPAVIIWKICRALRYHCKLTD